MKKQHGELIQQSVIISFHFFVYMLLQLLTNVSFFNLNSFYINSKPSDSYNKIAFL